MTDTKKKPKAARRPANPYRLFKRHDDEWESSLFCRCGSSFQWGGFDEKLEPWAIAHAKCYAEPKRGRK